jgi:hypothetical protein
MITLNSLSPRLQELWNVKDTFGSKKLTRAILNGFFYYEYIDEFSCKCNVYVYVDPLITGVPDSVINFAFKRVFAVAFGNLLSGEVFLKKKMNDAIKSKVNLANEVADRIGIP